MFPCIGAQLFSISIAFCPMSLGAMKPLVASGTDNSVLSMIAVVGGASLWSTAPSPVSNFTTASSKVPMVRGTVLKIVPRTAGKFELRRFLGYDPSND